MVQSFKCENNDWLLKTYDVRHQWCPAYSKTYFSGGIVSSQRSETTNRSLQDRLRSTDGLCDFYKHFEDVVVDWRNVENGDDFTSTSGQRYMVFGNVKLPKHAREVYTREVAFIFEKKFY